MLNNRKRRKKLLRWKSPSVKVTYSRNAAKGELDVNKMFAQKPCWKVVKSGSVKKPKKIIITDWTANEFNNGQPLIPFKQDLWTLLMKEGKKFGTEFYVWQGEGELVKVNNLQTLKSALKRVKPISHKELSAKLLNGNPRISSDESIIIDSVYAEQLDLELKNNSTKLKLPTIDLKKFQERNLTPGFFQDLAKSFHPTLKFAIALNHPKQIELLTTALAFAPQVHKLKIENMNESEVNELLSQLEGNQSEYDTVKSLKIKIENLKGTQLTRFLKLFPNIERLELSNCNLITADSKKINFNLKKLKKLKMSFTHLAEEVHEKLISSAPNIETLKLNSVSVNKSFNLPSLKELDIYLSIIKNEDLEKTLDSAEGLSKLTLNLLEEEITLEMKPHPNLEEVSLNLPISDTKLNSFLKKSPNVNSLTIKCQLDDNKFTSFDAPLSKLKNLDISPLKTNNDRLNNLLKSCPSLSHLKLYYNDESFPETPLSHSESVELRNGNFTKTDLSALFRQSSSLIFSSCQLPSFLSSNETFEKIESLSFSEDDLNEDNLSWILAHCPNLKKLSFDIGENITTSFLTKIQLPNITELTLAVESGFQIDKSDLNHFLRQAPHLEIIQFYNVDSQFLEDIETLDLKSNVKVKVPRKFKSNTISDEKLKSVLRLTVGIEELDLRRNPNITGSFFEDDTIDFSKITSINLSNTNVTDKIVTKLLLRCPNLTHLNLSNCKNILIHQESQRTFLEVIRNLTRPGREEHVVLKLEELKLSGTTVTNRHLWNLLPFTPYLKRITLKDTNLEEVESYKLIKEINSNIQIAGIEIDEKEKEKIDALIDSPKKSEFKIKSAIEKEAPKFSANTRLLDTTFSDVPQIFAFKDAAKGEPDPDSYRLKVHNNLKIGNKIELKDDLISIQYRQTYNKQEDLFSIYNKKYKKTPDVFFGSLDLPLSNSEWCPLPSLSADEEVLNLSSNIPLQLGYCEEQSLYYVKPIVPIPKGQKVNVSFLLRSKIQNEENPSKELQEEAKELFKGLQFSEDSSIIRNETFTKIQSLKPEEKLNYLVAFCHSFGKEGLKGKLNNDLEKLNALIDQAQGACAHRTWVFMALAKQFGIETRGVWNNVHAYVEVKQNGKWITKDLGGYPANVNVTPMATPEPKPRPTISTMPPKIAPKPANTTNPANRTTVNTRLNVNPNAKPSKDNRFVTWDTVKTDAKTYKEYFDAIFEKAKSLPPNQRNLLFKVEPDQIVIFNEYLTRYLKEANKNTFYLHSLDDVTEKSAHIKKDGSIEKVDSQLMQFTENAKEGDSIIANWSDYNAGFVGYNAMMDENRKIKTRDIREGVFVIGILDQTKADGLGEDFYSRFPIKCEPPAFADTGLMEKLKISNPKDRINLTEIEFFDDDWRKFLLGNIAINGKQFKIEKPQLIDAINNNAPGVVLTNAPWHLSEFRIFIAELMIKRKITFNGEEITLPDNFQIKETQHHYDLSKANLDVAIAEIEDNDDLHLNSETFSNFFKTRHCEKDLLFTKPGWLENSNSPDVSIYVTETLTVKQWAQLLKEAKRLERNLKIKLAPNVTIPTIDMAKVRKEGKQEEKGGKEEEKLPPNQIVTTNDLEYAEEVVVKANPDALVVSVNLQDTFSDLFEKTVPKDHPTDWLFESQLSEIWKRLNADKTVILKGQISPVLAYQLETLFNKKPYIWINGEKKYPTGKLILITESTGVFSHLSTSELNGDEKDYWSLLKTTQVNENSDQKADAKDLGFDEFEKLCKQMEKQAKIKFSYGQLRNMYQKIKAGNYSNPFKPYFRLNRDPNLQIAKDIWKPWKRPKQKFIDAEKRQNRILSEFQVSPYLFIAGSSGVGKSTHILDVLGEDRKKCKVFVGIDNLKKWLKDEKKRDHVLFIDEANIEKDGTWDILEGLFNKTPGIFIDGEFCPITDKHKVIFAGNYNYFEGRHQHKFFERHGQIFNFKELSPNFIKNKIIKRNLETAAPQLSAEEIELVTNKFFDIYTQANDYFSNHPGTLRNLKMMAMRLGVYLKDYQTKLSKEYSLEQLASLAAAAELSGMVKDINPFLEDQGLKTLHLEFSKELEKKIPAKINDFIVTDSRKNTIRFLQELFAIRQTQLENPKIEKSTLPGFLIEGAAGIGKSKLPIEYLLSLGFKKGNEKEPNADPSNCYYHLTPTDPEKLEQILVKAFHEGAVVIIDEINSLPLERVLNQLLSGQDLKGKKCPAKGFLVIGTQNPATFAGRQVLSEALENRFNKIYLNDYSENELRYIAPQICPNKEIADGLVTEYMIPKRYAEIHDKKPAPTPRDLFQDLVKVAKEDKLKIENTQEPIEAPKVKIENKKFYGITDADWTLINAGFKYENTSNDGKLEVQNVKVDETINNENGLRTLAKKLCPDEKVADQIINFYFKAKTSAEEKGKKFDVTREHLLHYLAQIAKLYNLKSQFVIENPGNSIPSIIEAQAPPSKEEEDTSISKEPAPPSTGKGNKDSLAKDPSVEVDQICRQHLQMILDLIDNHDFNLNGGGVSLIKKIKKKVEKNESEKKEVKKNYSKRAASIKELIETYLNLGKKLTHKTFDRISEDIEFQLRNKYLATKGSWFFGLGGRDIRTAILYTDIIGHLENLDTKLKTIARPVNDKVFNPQPWYKKKF